MVRAIDEFPVDVHLVEELVSQVEVVVRKIEIPQFRIGLSQSGVDIDQLWFGQIDRVGNVEYLPVVPCPLVVATATDIDVGQVRVACQQHLAVVCLPTVREHLFEIFKGGIVHAGDCIPVPYVVTCICQQVIMIGCQYLLACTKLFDFPAQWQDRVELGSRQKSFDI